MVPTCSFPIIPRFALLVLISALGATGCSGGGGVPATYPAKGSVVYENGQPFSGGTIEFQPVNDTSFSVMGEIMADGSFALNTIKNRAKVAGAVPGTYRVTIVPAIPADHKPVQSIALAKTYQVEAKDNHFSITVEPPRQGS